MYKIRYTLIDDNTGLKIENASVTAINDDSKEKVQLQQIKTSGIYIGEVKAAGYYEIQVNRKSHDMILVGKYTADSVIQKIEVPVGIIMPFLPDGDIDLYFGENGLGIGEYLGWSLCDGRNGTVDLRGLFIKGAEHGEEGYESQSTALPTNPFRNKSIDISGKTSESSHTHKINFKPLNFESNEACDKHTHEVEIGEINATTSKKSHNHDVQKETAIDNAKTFDRVVVVNDGTVEPFSKVKVASGNDIDVISIKPNSKIKNNGLSHSHSCDSVKLSYDLDLSIDDVMVRDNNSNHSHDIETELDAEIENSSHDHEIICELKEDAIELVGGDKLTQPNCYKVYYITKL